IDGVEANLQVVVGDVSIQVNPDRGPDRSAGGRQFDAWNDPQPGVIRLAVLVRAANGVGAVADEWRPERCRRVALTVCPDRGQRAAVMPGHGDDLVRSVSGQVHTDEPVVLALLGGE